MRPLLVACACVALVSADQPLYEFGETALVQLDDSNFEKTVLRDDKHLWVVEYYADWCGHCKQFAKGYLKAADNLKGIVKFGAVNADVNKKTSGSQGVQGFPSVKLYAPGTGQKNPYTGKFFKPPIDYNGPRSARGVVDFATATLPSAVVPVTDASFAKFKTNGTLPKALLLTKKTETTSLLKALSISFGGRMLVGEARDKEAKVAEELGVSDFPSLVVLPADGGEKVMYEGEHKPEALTAFLEGHAAAEPAAAESSESGASGDTPDFVVSVDATNVASLVEGERPAWLLVFAGTETADLPDDGIVGLAEALNGQAKVGRASSDLASKFGVTLGAAPVIAMYPFRRPGKPRKPTSFAGTSAGVTSAKKAVLETLPVDGVTVINTATMDRFMQESMMTSEAKAFVLLFSDKPTVPPLLRALALEFEGKLPIGMAQANDPQIASRFNVQKAPTLLVMFPDEKQKGEDGQVPLAGMAFNPQHHGKFNFGNIASFMSGFLQMRAEQMGAAGGAGGEGGEQKQQQQAPRQPKDLGPIPELSAENFDAECTQKGGLCGIAMLDGAESNSGKAPSLEMLTKLRNKRAGGPIAFSWLDATCHPNFAAAFELGDADLPTMIFLSPSKLKYARSVGAFDAETLSAFGTGVANGRKSTNDLGALPTLEEGVDCSTVKRGAEAYAEEEEGADDIMAEILEEERRKREELEASLAAEGVAAAAAAADKGGKKKKSEMSKLEALEADVEECEAMDLLCSARREKQLKAVEKERDLQAKLQKIAKKKKKAKKAAKKAA